MVLNIADFLKSSKSLQTPQNASYMLENGILTGFSIAWVHYGGIRKDWNLADFDQKAWAIAHGFEHSGFW